MLRAAPQELGTAAYFCRQKKKKKSFYFLCKHDEAARCSVCFPKLRKTERGCHTDGAHKRSLLRHFHFNSTWVIPTAIELTLSWASAVLMRLWFRVGASIIMRGSILVAAEASVPGPTAARAGLLAGQTQRDATAVDRLQVAWTGRGWLQAGVLLLAAETKAGTNAWDLHNIKQTTTSKSRGVTEKKK